jgi:hypothetical protein
MSGYERRSPPGALAAAWTAGSEALVAPLGVLDDLALVLPGVPPALDDVRRLRETYRRLEPLAWRMTVRLDVDGDQADELREDTRLHAWKRFTAPDGTSRDVALEVAAADPRGNLLKLRFAVERGTAAAGVLALSEPWLVERWAARLGGIYAPVFEDVPLLLVAPR